MARPERLDDDDISTRLGGLPGWEREGDEISKTFELPTFPEAIAFVTRIADRAEAANHHPDIDMDLPQPDGPTSTRNSPSSMSRSSLSTAGRAPWV